MRSPKHCTTHQRPKSKSPSKSNHKGFSHCLSTSSSPLRNSAPSPEPNAPRGLLAWSAISAARFLKVYFPSAPTALLHKDRTDLPSHIPNLLLLLKQLQQLQHPPHNSIPVPTTTHQLPQVHSLRVRFQSIEHIRRKAGREVQGHERGLAGPETLQREQLGEVEG